MSYQIARDGEQIGIYSEEELIDAVERGEIRITDLAWTEGMDEWDPVETLIEIEEEEEPETPVEDIPDTGSAETTLLASPPPQVKYPDHPAVRPLGQPVASTHYVAPPQAVQPSGDRYGAPPPQRVLGSPYASIPRGHYGPAGAAIASLVLGILSIVMGCFTGIPAIVCGHLAISKIRRSSNAFSGYGMAVSGLVIGYVMTAMTILVVTWTFLAGNIVNRFPSITPPPGPPPAPAAP